MVLLGFGLILVRLTIESASFGSPISVNICLTVSLSSFILRPHLRPNLGYFYRFECEKLQILKKKAYIRFKKDRRVVNSVKIDRNSVRKVCNRLRVVKM